MDNNELEYFLFMEEEENKENRDINVELKEEFSENLATQEEKRD